MASLSHVIAQDPKAAAKAIRAMGKRGDTILAHINPREARLLDLLADDKIDYPVNRSTGLPTFGDGDGTGTSGGGGGEGGDNGVGGPGNGSDGTGPGQGDSPGGGGIGGGDQTGVGYGGGMSFGSSTGQFSDNYGANVGLGMGQGAFGPNGEGLGIGDISGFGGEPSGSIGQNGDMSNFASPIGSLTSTFAGPEDMGQPAPAKPYDPLASPVTAPPGRPQVRREVDNFNNTVGKVTNLRQEVGVNPATKALDRHNYMDINPVSLGLGFVTGMPIGHLMDLANIKDPYGFSVDMGYGANASTNPDRDGDGYSDSAGDSSDQERRMDEGLRTRMANPGTLTPSLPLTNPGTLTPATPGSSYVPPTSPLSSVTPVAQTKLRARRGMMGDYAPNFRTSAV